MIKNKITLLNIEFHFGLGFLNALTDGIGMSLNELGQQVTSNRSKIVPLMMLHSMNYALYRKGEEETYTLDYVYDLIDDNEGMDGDFWNKFLLAFNDSMFKGVPVVEDKKKVTKKKV
jgi:hypothetical protein